MSSRIFTVDFEGSYNAGMMKNPSVVRMSFVMVPAFAFAVLFLQGSARAQTVSQTAMAGPYSVTLKVLPAESFRGPKAEMAWDSGSEPNHVNGPGRPNHHMVAFVKEKGAPVEHASVTIRYRQIQPHRSQWASLPVARMHVAGKGLETTHYGNNLRLAPGSYQVQVTVNGKGPAQFQFSM